MARNKLQWSVMGALAVVMLACISGGGSSTLPAGEAAPLFGIKQGGETVTLDELRDQVVLINFWSST